MKNLTNCLRSLLVGVIFIAGGVCKGYDLITDESGKYVIVWDLGQISMRIALPTGPILSDGTSQSSSVVAAIGAWNAVINVVQFSPQSALGEGYVIGDNINQIAMDSTVGGNAFGAGVLAVTQSWRSGNTRTESDIIFNNAYSWDSFQGGQLPGKQDIRRVAIHELGHVLGLDHPDEASPPQAVTAIMNSHVSYSPAIDSLRPDDVAGGHALYGTPGVVPANNNFANAAVIVLGGGSTTLNGTNVGATAEPFEPNHAGESARHSVWWKWVPSANGKATLTTLGSNFDTVLAVYTGASVSALTNVASNDDVQSGVIRTSALTFDATSGTTYYIAVDGWDGAFGLITLNLGVGPGIQSHPSSQTVVEGANVTFQVAASGPGLSYQWQRNGVVIPGAAGAVLTLNSVTPGDAGSYVVIVSNGAASTTSNAAILTVNALPAITGMVSSRLLLSPGQVTSLSVSATGTGPLGFQWIHNGRVVSGAGSSTLPLASVSAQDAGWYVVLITDSIGVRRSPPIFVGVFSGPTYVQAWGSNISGESTLPSGLENTVAIAAGSGHGLAVRSDGTVVGWGSGGSGAGSPPAGLNNVVKLAAGGSHSVALKSDGTVVAWGTNDSGQTNVPAGLKNVVAIAAGARGHTLALRSDGTVVAWGYNLDGQTNIPVGLSNVVSIAANNSGSVAVRADGTVVSWGSFSSPPPVGLSNVRSIALGSDHGLVLKQDGSVQSWGYNGYGQTSVPSGLNNVTAVAAGDRHSLALRSDGTVVVWGDSLYGQTTLPVGLVGVLDIASEYAFNLAIVSNSLPPFVAQSPNALSIVQNSVASFSIVGVGVGPFTYQWQRLPAGSATWTDLSNGGIYSGVTTFRLTVSSASSTLDGDQFRCRISNGNGSTYSSAAPLTVLANGSVVSASAGAYHSLFVRGDGTLWGMGSNSVGQIGVGTLLGDTAGPNTPVPIATNVATAIAAKGYYSLFIKRDGTLWAMGVNNSGQLGDGTLTQRNSPVSVGTGVVAADAGYMHSFFLKADGTLWAMGDNQYGQLGDGTLTNRKTPVLIATGAIAVSTGHFHTLFLKADGTLWAMGLNNEGQLGDGTLINRSTPIQIATGVATIATGNYHSFFVLTNGAMWATGANNAGQLGDGSTLRRLSPVFIASGVVAIAASSHSLFIKTDGTMWGMGSNYDGQLGNSQSVNTQSVPLQLQISVSAVSAGGLHSLFIKSDGTLLTSGANNSGQLGNGTYSQSYYALGLILSPQFLQHPADQTVGVGSSITFYARAVASPNPTYQWRKDGVNIPGATNSSYTIANVSNTDAASYSVVVTNTAGAVVSASANLTIVPTMSREPLQRVWLMKGTTLSTTSNLGTLNLHQQVAAAADVNGDGKPDLLWEDPVTGQRMLGLMNGTTSLHLIDLGVVDLSYKIMAAADFNGDGKSDILWQNITNGQRVIWLMNENGYAGGIDLGVVDVNWSAVAAADFNGDGKPDIVWQNVVSGQRVIWLMNGTNYAGSMDLGVVDVSWSIAGATDFNGDGKTDLLWQNLGSGQRVVWLMNGGSYDGGIDLGVADSRWRIAATADFNADGKPDIFWELRTLPIVDFNADGAPDLLLQNTTTGTRKIWILNGETTPAEVNLSAVSADWQFVAVVDLNRDGQADLVGQNRATGQRKVWYLNGTTEIGSDDLWTVDPVWDIAAVVDLNGDSQPDILWQNQATGQRSVWYLTGLNYAYGVNLWNVPTAWDIAAVKDLNGDGKVDVLWQNRDTGQRSVWYLNGVTYLSGENLWQVDPAWEIISLIDLDRDGHLDILWQNRLTGQSSIWYDRDPNRGVNLWNPGVDWKVVN